MSQEIVLQLPTSESHRELLKRKMDDYWRKAVIHTENNRGGREPVTVTPGHEVDTLLWENDTVAKAMIAREIIRFLLVNKQFEKNHIKQLELYQFLVAKIGLEKIEKLLPDIMIKLLAYVTYDYQLRNSLPIETT